MSKKKESTQPESRKEFNTGLEKITLRTMNNITFSVHKVIADQLQLQPNVLVSPMDATKAIEDDYNLQLKLQEKKGK